MYRYREPVKEKEPASPTPDSRMRADASSPLPRTTAEGKKRGRLARWRQGVRGLAPVMSGMVMMLLAIILYNMLFPGTPALTTRDVNQLVAKAMASATPPPPIASQVYAFVRPSLVRIQTHELGTGGKVEGSLGSGVIIDDTGLILTSLHVVQKAIDISVTFYDGTEANASVLQAQPDQDIAVLRPTSLPAPVVPAVLGNSRSVQPGDDAIVIGNPLGLTGSVTQGVISGTNRVFQPPNRDTKMTGLIQFDAAVNPGNSGGPLLNRNGEVVGIVTGLVNPTGQDVFVGIGFAVPIETAAGAAGSPPY